jgi:DNA-binding Lrp family transcriptional regulator
LKPDLAQQRRIMQAVQEGFPLCLHPYRELAQTLDMSEEQLLESMQVMLDQGSIRRIGLVPNHYALGYRYNLMVVWDIIDAEIDRIGEQVGQLDFVSHCYRRPRRPGWDYNLFSMVHGKSEQDVQAHIDELARLVGGHCRSHTALNSTAILKKTGLRLRSASSRESS